jgi:hypothetical protein
MAYSIIKDTQVLQMTKEISFLLDMMLQSYKKDCKDEQLVKKYQDELQYTIGRKYITINSMYGVRGFILFGKDEKFQYGDLLAAIDYKTPDRRFNRGNIFRLYEKATKEAISWHGIN